MSDIKTTLVDTSKWTEFGPGFFANKPVVHSTYYQWNEPNPQGFVSYTAQHRVLAAQSVDKQAVIEAIRADLVTINRIPELEIKAFLCLPSLIEIPKESGEAQMWGVSCYPFIVRWLDPVDHTAGMDALTPDNLKQLGVITATAGGDAITIPETKRCECGMHKFGISNFSPGHSRWCPVSV